MAESPITVDTELRFSLEVAPEASSISIARLFAGAVARRVGCEDDDVEDVKLAISEALTNAVKAHQTAHVASPISVRARADADGVTFEVVDEGEGFDVTEPPQDLSMTPAPGLYEGSLGLTVIRSLFPKVEIARNAESGMTIRFFAERGPAGR
jgi:serine/threonine-protein kinase RsbW